MIFSLLAQTPAATGSPAAAPSSGAGNLLILLPLFGLLYFFMIRPQKRAKQNQMALMRAVEVGDEIETVAGMFGRITRTDDTSVWVELAPGMTVHMARGAIRRKVIPDPTPGDDAGS